MSIFGITLVLLSICTNVTGHTAMVTNPSRPGAIRIMPQMYVLKVFIWVTCVDLLSVKKKVSYFNISLFN